MSRCPDCQKFVSLEMQDPEVESCEIDIDGAITASVRIVRSCAECSTEMKEATLEIEYTPDEDEAKIVEEHQGDAHELIVEDGYSVEALEEGGGRYAKSFFGATLSVSVRCKCQKGAIVEPLFTVELSDKVSASAMDEMN